MSKAGPASAVRELPRLLPPPALDAGRVTCAELLLCSMAASKDSSGFYATCGAPHALAPPEEDDDGEP